MTNKAHIEQLFLQAQAHISNRDITSALSVIDEIVKISDIEADRKSAAMLYDVCALYGNVMDKAV